MINAIHYANLPRELLLFDVNYDSTGNEARWEREPWLNQLEEWMRGEDSEHVREKSIWCCILTSLEVLRHGVMLTLHYQPAQTYNRLGDISENGCESISRKFNWGGKTLSEHGWHHSRTGSQNQKHGESWMGASIYLSLSPDLLKWEAARIRGQGLTALGPPAATLSRPFWT